MSEQSESRKSSQTILGLRLFAIYTLFYASFVLVNAFAPQWADIIVVAGLNLAIVWGFALIGLAFILAMVYGLMCGNLRTFQDEHQDSNGDDA